MGPRFRVVVLGILQFAAGVAVAAWWRARHPVVVPHVGNDYETAQLMIHGVAQLIYFAVATPTGWLADWLVVEGTLRMFAGVGGLPLGTAPVAIARFVAARARRPKPPPDDVVTRAGDAIVIDSARDYGWDALATVEVDGALYAVAREPGAPLRPHRYRLTPIGAAHLVRVVSRYPRDPR